MAACLRCEEWEKSLSLFQELCPGTDLWGFGPCDLRKTIYRQRLDFFWWKVARSDFEAHRIIICRGFVQLPPGRLFVAKFGASIFLLQENTNLGFLRHKNGRLPCKHFWKCQGLKMRLLKIVNSELGKCFCYVFFPIISL